MRKVHFIGGEKGGVGKSMTARLLAQYHIDKDLDFVGFDCDSSHATFSRFYSDFASSVVIGDDDSLDGMLATIEEFPEKDLIIDLAAQSAKPLDKWIAETDVFGLLDELGYQVCLWHVMDDGADSVSLLDKLLNQYKDSEVDFVVVQNYGRGSDFSRFKASATFKAAEKQDALILDLPKLQTKLTQKMDFNNSSFWAVANNKSLMNIAERQRMRVWLRNAYEQLDQLG
ncbi:mobilization protein [Marinomonas balearica]|uniref:CobQ/CobB/MinD/ParA nucleotide binding domain-containing protein n=1 Tax=Marinomonas balearica TaxID=491947 RepID=A0A4R6MCP8_9GAMM|nr:mobilization protein [Marinomonas balearica]TDO98945.1 hypothetical protein DFP79_1369 [Marinomonas balearica]